MPANLNHPSFVQPDDPAVPLWRYMDLSKFAALLQRKALVFGRADTLGDRFEGSVPQVNADMLKHIREVRKSDPDNDLYKGVSDEALEKMFRQLSDVRNRAVRAHFISCWHMNEAESAAMWKLYSKSSEAVCIRTDYATLASVLPEETYLGIIRYIDYNSDVIPEDNLFAAFLIKRRSFAHEREARAIVVDWKALLGTSVPASIREVSIDVDRLIKEIYVSPESPDWFREVVENLTNTYGLTVRVKQSEMDSKPLY